MQSYIRTLMGLAWLAIPVTVFAVLGVINSFNLIDGLDGLSGALFIIAATSIALFAGLAGHSIEFSGLPDYFSFYVFMGFAFSCYFYLKYSWAAQRFLGRHFIHDDFDIEEG